MSESYVVPDGYVEHAPPEDLAAHVACVWTRRAAEGAPAGPAHLVLPDGCVDILLRFGREGDPTDAELRAVTAVGPMTRALRVAGGGPRLYVGVRFRPGSAFAALGIPAAALMDTELPAAELPGASSEELDALAAARTDEARVRAAVELVRRRLAGAPGIPPSVRVAVRRITGAHGGLRVALLAAEIGVTRQHLARQFAVHVGVSPKLLARVMRTQAVLARADAARAAYPRNVDWSAIAYDLGYYDQPHFIDDFRALTGTTPGEWYAPEDATSRPSRAPERTP